MGPVTVSIGIAALRNGETPNDLLERADSRLYLAKERGRNRVVASE
jgi:diguanylate cyclase (GGDEF)-like protein